MTLKHNFETLARTLGLSTIITKRLVGDTVIKSSGSGSALHLGLRLLMMLQKEQGFSTSEVEGLQGSIQEVKSRCPHVFRWLTSGAFDPTKIPDDVSVARLQHAVRTFGRVRAEFLRRCGKTVGE